MNTPRTTTTTRTVVSRRPGTYAITYRHRLDGPTYTGVYPSDTSDHLMTIWNQHGLQHRLDGPSNTLSDSGIFWTVEGNNITTTHGHPGTPHDHSDPRHSACRCALRTPPTRPRPGNPHRTMHTHGAALVTPHTTTNTVNP